ncbi:MAG TPA: efflux RND transporter periplasmic adaptor subunit [Thermoanaerobaculia bacterium]|jgi:membrane fusion protein (multidrug efflux system)|nr:efflux RND transporter periplasmic adaptor subunit [Thermoanaerobaculia bacterium]
MPGLRRAIFWTLALIAIAALAAPKLMNANADRGRDRSSAGDGPGGSGPALKSQPPEVRIHVVAPERLAETLISPGTLVANERIEVVSENAGLVARIDLEEGAHVAAGDLLVKIDDRELVTERDRITARLELAERQAKRQSELHEQGLISDDELEVATTEADALEAELAQVGVRLAKTEIRAPFAGILGLRRVSEGAFLSPQTRIVTLVQSDPMKLEFAVPERYAARYRPGDSVTFQVEGIEGERRASIYAIEPSVDPATRTVPMRATTPNADGRLLPGAFADVSVAVRDVADALTVPSIAIVPELGGKKLWVLENGAAQPRQVETGIRTGDRVEVTRGLQAGDAVITSGIQILRPGLAVTVATESGAPAATPGTAALGTGG